MLKDIANKKQETSCLEAVAEIVVGGQVRNEEDLQPYRSSVT